MPSTILLVFVKIDGEWRWDECKEVSLTAYQPYKHFFAEIYMGQIYSHMYLYGSNELLYSFSALDDYELFVESLNIPECEELYNKWKELHK